MAWLRIRFPAMREQVQPLSVALEEHGALSVSLEGRDDEQILQAATEEKDLWEDCTVTGLFANDTDVTALLGALRRSLAPSTLDTPAIETLADDDWAGSWKEHCRPFIVAPGIWICPSWLPPPDPSAVTLRLDPGMAFGTGEHPTTALCLTWLTEQNLKGASIIDYGTGSGILAMAALKLGAATAVGVDIDPTAVEIARDNLARNALAGCFTAVTPDAVRPGTQADIVLANILANPLCELAPVLAGLLKPGGRMVLSGMLADQADRVITAYRDLIDFQTRREQGGWVLLAGSRV